MLSQEKGNEVGRLGDSCLLLARALRQRQCRVDKSKRPEAVSRPPSFSSPRLLWGCTPGLSLRGSCCLAKLQSAVCGVEKRSKGVLQLYLLATGTC